MKRSIPAAVGKARRSSAEASPGAAEPALQREHALDALFADERPLSEGRVRAHEPRPGARARSRAVRVAGRVEAVRRSAPVPPPIAASAPTPAARSAARVRRPAAAKLGACATAAPVDVPPGSPAGSCGQTAARKWTVSREPAGAASR